MGCCNTKNDALDTRDVTLEPKDGGVADPKPSAASADSAKAQDGNASPPVGEPPAAADTVTVTDSTDVRTPERVPGTGLATAAEESTALQVERPAATETDASAGDWVQAMVRRIFDESRAEAAKIDEERGRRSRDVSTPAAPSAEGAQALAGAAVEEQKEDEAPPASAPLPPAEFIWQECDSCLVSADAHGTPIDRAALPARGTSGLRAHVELQPALL